MKYEQEHTKERVDMALEEEAYRQQKRRTGKSRRRKRKVRMVLLLDMALLLAVLVAGGILLYRNFKREPDQHLSEISDPGWYTEAFLTINPYSRPGTKREYIRDIVVHYVANPGTTAKQNRDYFEGLKEQNGSHTVSASSHFVIGTDGTIIQCIPLDEVAYANYPRNDDTVSIECCHPDASGKFTDATIASLVKLTRWLCGELSLNEKHIIRHYDVIGKNCPKYYVEHEDAWKELKKRCSL